jgi:hypothetical protein
MAKQDETKPVRQRVWGDMPRDDKEYDREPTWFPHRLRLTGELVGGFIAGVGMGMAIALEREWPFPVVILLILIGGSIAYYYQHKRDDEKRNPRE